MPFVTVHVRYRNVIEAMSVELDEHGCGVVESRDGRGRLRERIEVQVSEDDWLTESQEGT